MQWELTKQVQFCNLLQDGFVPSLLHKLFVDTQRLGCYLEITDADGCIKRTESSSYYIWHILLFQIHKILKKVVQKLQSANVTTPSVASVLLGQPPIWGFLY